MEKKIFIYCIIYMVCKYVDTMTVDQKQEKEYLLSGGRLSGILSEGTFIFNTDGVFLPFESLNLDHICALHENCILRSGAVLDNITASDGLSIPGCLM